MIIKKISGKFIFFLFFMFGIVLLPILRGKKWVQFLEDAYTKLIYP